MLRRSAADFYAEAFAVAAEHSFSPDDFAAARTQRSDVTDPPFIVTAYRVTGHRGDEFQSDVGIDHPSAGTWQPATGGGKQVLVGANSMIDQTSQVQGRPYIWNGTSAHYVIVTSSEAWASEVLQGLE